MSLVITDALMSADTNKIDVIDSGALSDIQWPGKISAKQMVDTKETSDKALLNIISHLNDYYVDVDKSAPTRCIDGRQDPGLDRKHLGAQVPGGAPGAALAFRLGVDKDDLTRGTFLADAESMIANFLRLGFAPGGHRDENSANGPHVGCGAIDGLDQILSAMTNPALVDDHKRVVKLLLGPLFDRDSYLRVMGAAVVVNGRSEEYFRGRESIIDILETRSKKSIAVLKGNHKECLVIVNMAPNTTLESNKLIADTGVQAFGYDIWRSVQMAGRILPREDQWLDRQRFVMARVMMTVAALMVLTDGSQRLVLRMPKIDRETSPVVNP